MKTSYSLTERTAPEALRIWKTRTNAQTIKTPLRFRPVIVVGPTEGYIVIELGYAEANDLHIINVRDLMN
ncbi:hypothetical protein [Armatimonas sp.]|uniref:hypothetical protein n=1 Tax=Armatimonas sp. TaxID=1872638 RepID=UPI00374D4BAD